MINCEWACMMLECDDRGGYRIGMARRKKVKEIKSGMESERGTMGSGGEHEGERPPTNQRMSQGAFDPLGALP